jgi:phage terminase small subunit
MSDQEPTPQQIYEAALAALKPKQRAFVVAYLVCLNAAEAARRAGYSEKTARSIGAENLTKPDIAAAIKAGFETKAMPSEEVLARLAEHARGSMGDFLRVDEEEVTLTWSLLSLPTTKEGEPDIAGVTLQLAAQENVQPTDRILHTATIKRAVARLDLLQAKDKLHLIKKYTLDEKGKVSIELYDAQAALVVHAKHHGLLVERHELSGPGGGAIPLQFTQALDKAYGHNESDDTPASSV